jgi:hypothetical protein
MATARARFASFEKQLAKYRPGVHRLNPGASDAALEFAGKQLKLTFPSVYREFLSRWNGGILFGVGTMLFAIRGPVSGVTDYKTQPGEDLITRNQSEHRWPGTPKTHLIVGASSTGDTFNLDLESGEGDEINVVRWNHESAKPSRRWNTYEKWLDSEMKDGSKRFDYEGNVR